MVEAQKKIDKFRHGLIKTFYFVLKLGISLGLGYFTAQSSLMGELSPFSLILLTCSNSMDLVPVGCYLGSTFGYLAQPFNLYLFKYITALTMIYVIYIVFGRSFRAIRGDMAISSAACCFISGFLFLLVDRLSLFNILLLTAESVLISCSIFFVSYAVRGFKKNCYLTSRELIAAAVTLVLLLISLHNVTLFQMSAARIIGILVIFLGMSILKTSHAAVLGSCIGIILAAVSGGGEAIFTAVIVSTLMGCVFSNFSERFAEVSMMVVYYAILIFFGKFPWNYWLFAEPILAFSVAFFIPKDKLRSFLSSYIVVRKLNGGKKENDDIQKIFEKCRQECEAFCPKAASCYQKYQEPLLEGLEELAERYRQTEELGEIDLHLPFCSRINSMTEIISRQLILTNSANFEELTREFDEISQKIEQKIEASAYPIQFLEEEENEIKKRLGERKISVKEINFIIDEQNARRCDITFDYTGDLLYEKIFRQVLSPFFTNGFALHLRHFEEEGLARAIETNQFCITCAAICKTRDGEELCGDKANGFSAGGGIYYLLLADGMGSGREASIQSENAIETLRRLLLGGLSVTNAVRIFRSASRLRQSNSFTTLDICKIDLNTGNADFYKAGAFDSFCMRDEKMIVINGGGMPPGLGTHERMKHTNIKLADRTTLIMASDGLSLLENTLEPALIEAADEDVRQYARNIHKKIADSTLGIDDDVTVIVAKFKMTEE